MGKATRVICGLGLVLLLAGAAGARDVPASDDYGKVIIANFSAAAGLAPVRFDHWLHRAFFTCRLCHVDIGFAMEAKATKITADMNAKGFYCGSCHNGTMVHNGKKIFPSCTPSNAPPSEQPECLRCHSVGMKDQRKYTYASFTATLPRQALGNLVDWEEAEAWGLIRPADFLPGLSTPRRPLGAQADFSITSKGFWMADIIFSHKKHAQWNGCEVCHPDIFPSVKKGTVKYTMFEIADGQYCGLCHDRVAFPLNDCGKCHTGKAHPRP